MSLSVEAIVHHSRNFGIPDAASYNKGVLIYFLTKKIIFIKKLISAKQVVYTMQLDNDFNCLEEEIKTSSETAAENQSARLFLKLRNRRVKIKPPCVIVFALAISLFSLSADLLLN